MLSKSTLYLVLNFTQQFGPPWVHRFTQLFESDTQEFFAAYNYQKPFKKLLRLTPIEIIDIECVLGHESCRRFFSHACPYKSAILNLIRSENDKA